MGRTLGAHLGAQYLPQAYIEVRVVRGSSCVAASPQQSASPMRVLRLSLSARAEFRSSCCASATAEVPDGRLDARQLVALVAAFARLGVRSVRLTGVGTAIAPCLVGLVERIRRVPGIEEIALTAGSLHIAALAGRLRSAGVSRLTLLVDTLDPAKLRSLHGRSASLVDQLQGVEAAACAGFDVLKLDVTVIRDINDRELPSLVRFAWRHGAIPRLIELMPFGRGDPVPVAEMKEILLAGGIRLGPDSVTNWGPAECLLGLDRAGPCGRLRLVGPIPRAACASCERVRAGPDGSLRACVGRSTSTALAPMLRAGADPAELTARIASALGRAAQAAPEPCARPPRISTPTVVPAPAG